MILILSAVAVPNYMDARARANEASSVTSVRAIISAQNLYRNTFGTFADLPSLSGDYLTDYRLAAGSKSGYIFSSSPAAGTDASLQFTVQATPELSTGPAASGKRTYFGDQSAVVRFSQTGPANSGSPPIE